MGIASPLAASQSKPQQQFMISSSQSMSQDYHDPAIFTGFSSSRFERTSLSATASAAPDAGQHDVAHQIRRDRLRVPGFEFDPSMVGMDEEEPGGIPGYETSGLLSERFSFGAGSAVAAASATELLEQQYIAAGFRAHRGQTAGATSDDWYGLKDHQSGGASVNMNVADSATAMQLFLMSPQPRSPSPSPRPPPHHQMANPSSSTLHMLLPNSSNPLQGFNASTASFGSGAIMPPLQPPQFTWVPDGGGHGVNPNPSEIPRVAVEGQGLSLSLSSSLQRLDAAKAEEYRLSGDGGNLLFYNNQVLSGGVVGGISTVSAHHQYPYKNFAPPGPAMHLQAGYGASSLGVVNILRNSKYLRAAQELLEEFCSVGRGQFRKSKQLNRNNSNPGSSGNPGTTAGNNHGGSGGGSSSSSKEAAAALSAPDRMEHQRRKVKLLSMLDEVDRRYDHYCEQMQMVVSSFDLVMGFGSAIPYTALAQKAMSRHFRCLKDAIAAQLKHSCEILGEKDGAGNSGLTKGETPRLKLLDQSLRQQRAYHQMGMMEQEAWRPQRGLPERSVNILRAWLFEHFLHPYPSDADKHLLARQTGLSRNQVSNWFINARVRLWKPMVEEMYQQEAKDEDEQDLHEDDADINTPTTAGAGAASQTVALPPPSSTTIANTKIPMAAVMSDSDLLSINRPCFSEHQAAIKLHQMPSFGGLSHGNFGGEEGKHGDAVMPDYGTMANNTVTTAQIASFGNSSIGNGNGNPDDVGLTLIRFGTTAGDVSLTLGLHHAGNMPEKSSFSVTDFGSC